MKLGATTRLLIILSSKRNVSYKEVNVYLEYSLSGCQSRNDQCSAPTGGRQPTLLWSFYSLKESNYFIKKKKSLATFPESYTTARKRFLFCMKCSAKLTSRESCARKMILYIFMLSTVQGRGCKQMPVMICNCDTPRGLKMRRSLSLGLTQNSAALLSSSL